MAQLGSPNEVKAFTILRDPYGILESSYSYRNIQKHFGMDIKGFIQLLRQNDPSATVSIDCQIGIGLYIHSLAFNLGMPMTFIQDEAAIELYITKIGREIDLVMITERIEESLILFQYFLCWKQEDVVIFDKNVRGSNSEAILDEDDRNELGKWLKADLKIYNLFL